MIGLFIGLKVKTLRNWPHRKMMKMYKLQLLRGALSTRQSDNRLLCDDLDDKGCNKKENKNAE